MKEKFLLVDCMVVLSGSYRYEAKESFAAWVAKSSHMSPGCTQAGVGGMEPRDVYGLLEEEAGPSWLAGASIVWRLRRSPGERCCLHPLLAELSRSLW